MLQEPRAGTRPLLPAHSLRYFRRPKFSASRFSTTRRNGSQHAETVTSTWSGVPETVGTAGSLCCTQDIPATVAFMRVAISIMAAFSGSDRRVNFMRGGEPPDERAPSDGASD